MDLEELQLAWTQMGEELETQKKLTKSIILEMTRTRYKNKFEKINNCLLYTSDAADDVSTV